MIQIKLLINSLSLVPVVIMPIILVQWFAQVYKSYFSPYRHIKVKTFIITHYDAKKMRRY